MLQMFNTNKKRIKTLRSSLLLIFFCSGLIFACKDSSEEDEAPVLEVAQNAQTQIFDEAGGDCYVTVTADQTYIATVEPDAEDWCSASIVNRKAPVDNLKISVTPNTGLETRSAKITLSGTGVTSVEITVTQTGISPILWVEPAQLNQFFNYRAVDRLITVITNLEFTASVETSGIDWCTTEILPGATNNLKIALSTNNGDQRMTKVILSAAGVPSIEIIITQKGLLSTIVYTKVSTIRPDPNTTALWVEGNWTSRWPLYITCDIDENLFITDNDRILVKIDKQKLDAGEKSWEVLAEVDVNEISRMNGVFASPDGKLVFLVEDWWEQKPQWKKIHVFDPENNWALQHVNTGIAPTDVARVLSTMAVDENGVFYFIDSGNKKFYKLVAPNRSPEGTGEGGEGKDYLTGNSRELLYDFSSVINADLYGAIYCLAYSQIDKRIYFSTYDESVIRYWDLTFGTWHLLAGSTPGYAEGTGAEAQFKQPNQIAVDENGNVIVVDRGNHCIRRITPAGETSVIAGTPGVAGYNDGEPASALFNNPYGVCISPKDGSTIYVSDLLNYKIRKISIQ
jgi:sugar lactone lactonase YvrE